MDEYKQLWNEQKRFLVNIMDRVDLEIKATCNEQEKKLLTMQFETYKNALHKMLTIEKD